MYSVIGLTGGIASGKSTASAYIEEKGYPVLDADKFARQATEKGGPSYDGIVESFGEEILAADGEIDRKKLGSVIFNDPGQRKVLNNLVHPVVRRMMNEEKDRLIRENHVFMDIPLLFENGLDAQCDITLTVYVDQWTQKARLMERNDLTEADSDSRINSQMPLIDKKNKSDFVLDNSGSRENLYEQIEKFLTKIEK